MKELHELKSKMMDELKDQAREIGKKGRMSGGDLDTVAKLTKSIDRLCEIMEKDEGGYSERGYSRDGRWAADMRGEYSRDGYSGRRDSMGRFSREGGSSYGYSGNSYSQHGKNMVDEMEGLLKKADEHQRPIIERAIRDMSG